MKIQLNGTLKAIFAEEKISDKLSKKEIVVTIDEDTQYPNDISCQAINGKIDMLDSFKMGDKVSVVCDLRGKANTNSGKYYNNIVVLEIKKA